jgi:ankyrin repeat protein
MHVAGATWRLFKRISNRDALMRRLVSNFGVDVNRTDEFDASPLMLASLCGHAEVVRFLLNAGAILDRHSFQGERYSHSLHC